MLGNTKPELRAGIQWFESLPYFLQIGSLLIIYFFTAKFGLALDAVSGFATLVWPPTGIAIAALLLFGVRLWPSVALGAFLVNVLNGAPTISAVFISLGNTAEAVIAFYILQAGSGFKP